ncbi:hypothetical protein Tsubulata_017876 [Turnera subulata]|uniref:Mediator-associated protein 2 n=1 Tax=Turnera subulata TaxID=218843 RepID=A0A9Q0G372_9ROSI|nr:hypothetical protein Tsubulata_017876 [Turnera subulata]
MDAVREEEEEEGYKPAAGFRGDSREPLIDLELNDSTELWLLQWPLNELPDFDGQELTLNLNTDGCLSSFQDSSGKSYNVISYSAQDPDATVFVSSNSETKAVGKISRRGTFVHFPDPKVLEEQEAEKKSKQHHQMRSGQSPRRSSTPSRSVRNSQSSGRPASTYSSRQKSSLSELGDQSTPRKKRRVQRTGSTDRSTLDSGRGHSIPGSHGT